MNGPASTGAGSDVETISLLTATLSSLAAINTSANESKPPQSQPSNGLGLLSNVVAAEMTREETHAQSSGSQRSLEEVDSDEEQTYLTTLAQVTKGFSDRCVSFQSGLLEVVRQMTQRLPHGISSEHNDLFAAGALQKQIAKLELTCQDLELRIKDLARAREDANESERKVRRGLYRVASGRMKIEEVLQVGTSVFFYDGLIRT